MDLLATLSEADRGRVLSATKRHIFARGETVFERGDPAGELHLITKGRFAVQVTTTYGDTATLTILGTPGFFGELALLGDEKRSATIVAMERGETRTLAAKDFAILCRARPEFRDVVTNALTAQVRRLSSQLVEALYIPADTRVRHRLSEMAAIYDEGLGVVIVPLTQEMIAGMAGTSRATVNRVLREDEKAGRVRIGRGRVEVIDAAALAR